MDVYRFSRNNPIDKDRFSTFGESKKTAVDLLINMADQYGFVGVGLNSRFELFPYIWRARGKQFLPPACFSPPPTRPN